MSTYYPYYLNYIPIIINEWNPVVPIQNSMNSLPIIISPAQVLATQLYPNAGIVTQPTATISPVFLGVVESQGYPYTFKPLVTYDAVNMETPMETFDWFEYYCIPEEKVLQAYNNNNNNIYYNSINEFQELEAYGTFNGIKKEETNDPLEFYLALPKQLFPPARTLLMDPNPIIDEFCKIANLDNHISWILDLEFGIPKKPTKHPIPTYDVKLNSIHCKNTPNTIHPGFEECNQDFKRALLFYYNYVVSTWYKGYTALNHDKSLETFQSWLILPLQVLGMCWP